MINEIILTQQAEVIVWCNQGTLADLTSNLKNLDLKGKIVLDVTNAYYKYHDESIVIGKTSATELVLHVLYHIHTLESPSFP